MTPSTPTLSVHTPPGMPIAVEAENPLLSGMGPAAWADRPDHPDYTAHGEPKIRPLSALPNWWLEPRDPDPRGWPVHGGDGVMAGTVVDVWVDTAEPSVRYYEVQVAANSRRVLLPYGFAKIRTRHRRIDVRAIYAAHFAQVPGIRNATTVTLLEEDQVMAYYAGGLLWADPSRSGPVL